MRSTHMPGYIFERVTRRHSPARHTLTWALRALLVVSFPIHYGQSFIALSAAGAANGLPPHSIAIRAQAPHDKPASPIDHQKQDDPEKMRKTIKRLQKEIADLHSKVTELERMRQVDTLHDRLTKEEQRVEQLQQQLLEVAEKEAGLQGRMDEINEQLRPENIAQLQIYGSLRPEQARENTRVRLTAEKERIQSQLALLQQSHKRLQASLAVNDLVILRLRAQLQGALQH